jgi:predicted O-linked N-acetylglucosamine transferase (SPINDLY family)
MATTDETLQAALDHHRAGRYQQAEALYREVLEIDPRHAGAHHLLGVLALDTGRFGLAHSHLGAAVTLDPSQAHAHSDLGEVYRALAYPDQARSCYEEALRLDPGHVAAQNGLGLLRQQAGDWEGAEACFREAVRLAPGQPVALNNLGTLLLHRGRLDEARARLDEALRLRPDYPEALNNLGAVWMRLGRYTEAHSCFENAVRLKPAYAVAHHNLGSVLHRSGRLAEAEASLRIAIQLNPVYAPAHFELGAVLKDALRLGEAQAALEEALRINPKYVEALSTLAAVLALQGKPSEARFALGKAGAIRPSDALMLRSALILPVVYESSDEIDQERVDLRQNLAALSACTLSIDDPAYSVGLTPFFLAYQGGNDREIHEALASVHRKATPGLDFTAPHCLHAETGRGERIRVGFLSNFFHEHTVGRLNIGFVRHLSRERFEVTLLRFPGPDDPMARAFDAAADRVVTLPRRLEVARPLVADERLDVLIYPEIGMDPLTYFLAFARLAPVQCVGWGHPVTTGIPTVDHFLSCALMEREGSDAEYSESLVRFDRVNSCYDEPQPAAPAKSRRNFGLDDGAHLYVCSQSLFKVHPAFDEALGAILRADPHGLAVFLSGPHPQWGQLLSDRFRRSFPREADRFRFLPRMPRDDFLQLQSLADVLLDTFPFGGGNTSYEAFAFGTPVVTLRGPSLRGRITSALYEQMGVLDCVAERPDDYADLAVRLGTGREWRSDVRGRILAAKHEIFGDVRPVRELERFLTDATRRQRGGEPRANRPE